jgi:hypothetical protein
MFYLSWSCTVAHVENGDAHESGLTTPVAVTNFISSSTFHSQAKGAIVMSVTKIVFFVFLLLFLKGNFRWSMETDIPESWLDNTCIPEAALALHPNRAFGTRHNLLTSGSRSWSICQLRYHTLVEPTYMHMQRHVHRYKKRNVVAAVPSAYRKERDDADKYQKIHDFVKM